MVKKLYNIREASHVLGLSESQVVPLKFFPGSSVCGNYELSPCGFFPFLKKVKAIYKRTGITFL